MKLRSTVMRTFVYKVNQCKKDQV